MKNKEAAERILNFLKKWPHSYGPSMREIMDGIGAASGETVVEAVRDMADRGLIEYSPGIARSIRLKREVHKSDCAKHSDPAYPARPCDCGAEASPLAAYDDGSAVYLDSYSGGAHPAGAWGEVVLRFTKPGEPDRFVVYTPNRAVYIPNRKEGGGADVI